jgi:hypothetical protein
MNGAPRRVLVQQLEKRLSQRRRISLKLPSWFRFDLKNRFIAPGM